ncbi:MAG: hypothetical protein M1830_000907 [Pleopsidium flavum]|nr:MAG: hypothetical protein M1830_000907 [Pleopsidium flavum]
MPILFPRSDCEKPQQFYTCASNGFNGCCSIDPCGLPGCPDPRSNNGGETDSPDATDKTAQSKSKADKTQDPTVNQNSLPTNPVTAPVQVPSITQLPSIIQLPSTTQAAPSAAPSSAPQQQSSVQSQATSQQPATSSPSAAASSQPPVTIVVTSQVVQTPTSNGVALAPTTLLLTSTSVSSPAAVSQTSSSTPAAVSTTSSSSSSSAPIIAGVVAGVVGAVIAAVLLWFCCRRRSKRRKDMREEKAAHGHEDDPRQQGIDANRAGDVIAGYGDQYRGPDRHSKVKVRDSMATSESTAGGTEHGHHIEKKLLVSPITPNRQAFAEDAVPNLDSRPLRPNLEMAGSSPDPTGFTPELSGVAAPHQPAELSPNPERLRINNRSSAYSVNSNAGPGTSDGSVMRSNLNLSNRGHNRRVQDGVGRHVMSWVEYGGQGGAPRPEAANASPISGVWSSADSSTVRNSGVSQASPTLGWQHEKRTRDSRGGLEAIRDESRS